MRASPLLTAGCLAACFSAPTAAQEVAASTPSFGDAGLDKLYAEMATAEATLSRNERELESLEESYRAHPGADPASPRRKELRDDMDALLSKLWIARRDFHDMETRQRVAESILMFTAVKTGEDPKANAALQDMKNRADVVGEATDFVSARQKDMAREQEAFEEARGLYLSARLHRRVAGGALAMLAAAALALYAARRPRRAPAPSPKSEPSPAGPPPTDDMGPYRLAGPAPPWAFGLRCEAVEDATGKRAWVHTLDSRFHPRPGDDERLAAALRKACAFKDPAVPELLSAFTQRGRVYLATAAAQGLPLTRWLEEGRPVPLPTALAALLPAAAALDAAHAAGVVHAALTPESLLVGPGGGASLLDLGLAMAVGSVASTARVGLPAYASPEQEAGRVDARSDLYAFGVILYETLTGRHPFDGPNLQALRQEMRFEPPTRFAALPEGVDPLLNGLLAADPELRLPAPGGLRAALQQLGSGAN